MYLFDLATFNYGSKHGQKQPPWVAASEPSKQTNVVTTQDRAKNEQKNMTAKFYIQRIKKNSKTDDCQNL